MRVLHGSLPSQQRDKLPGSGSRRSLFAERFVTPVTMK